MFVLELASSGSPDMQPDSATNWIYPWPPRIQVAGVSSLREALFCKRVEVDSLGFTLRLPRGIHDGLTEKKAAYIISRLPAGILPLVITYVQGASEACGLARSVGAAAIQFHGGIIPKEISLFRKLCPSVRTIGLVTVTGRDAIERAAQFSRRSWDCIILDSRDLVTGKTGATGSPHDWNISAEIVRIAKVPVILAGGLTAENVAQAIEQVRPHGVDAHTGLERSDGTRSFSRIEAFARAAQEAFKNSPPFSVTQKV
jgi:phosphoribosylanthranilate isomerase